MCAFDVSLPPPLSVLSSIPTLYPLPYTHTYIYTHTCTHTHTQPPSRELASLSPVPEAHEGDDEEVKEKRGAGGDKMIMKMTAAKPSSQPTAPAASHKSVKQVNTSTSTLSSQQSSTSDLTKKGTCVECIYHFNSLRYHSDIYIKYTCTCIPP